MADENPVTFSYWIKPPSVEVVLTIEDLSSETAELISSRLRQISFVRDVDWPEAAHVVKVIIAPNSRTEIKKLTGEISHVLNRLGARVGRPKSTTHLD